MSLLITHYNNTIFSYKDGRIVTHTNGTELISVGDFNKDGRADLIFKVEDPESKNSKDKLLVLYWSFLPITKLAPARQENQRLINLETWSDYLNLEGFSIGMGTFPVERKQKGEFRNAFGCKLAGSKKHLFVDYKIYGSCELDAPTTSRLACLDFSIFGQLAPLPRIEDITGTMKIEETPFLSQVFTGKKEIIASGCANLRGTPDAHQLLVMLKNKKKPLSREENPIRVSCDVAFLDSLDDIDEEAFPTPDEVRSTFPAIEINGEQSCPYKVINIGDINGDNRDDLAVVTDSSVTLLDNAKTSILRSVVDGETFAVSFMRLDIKDVACTSIYKGPEASDSHKSIACAHEGGVDIYQLDIEDGPGTLKKITTFTSPGAIQYSVASGKGDFDNLGKHEWVMSDGTYVTGFYGRTTTPFPLTTNVNMSSPNGGFAIRADGTKSVFFADVDADRYSDIVMHGTVTTWVRYGGPLVNFNGLSGKPCTSTTDGFSQCLKEKCLKVDVKAADGKTTSVVPINDVYIEDDMGGESFLFATQCYTWAEGNVGDGLKANIRNNFPTDSHYARVSCHPEPPRGESPNVDACFAPAQSPAFSDAAPLMFAAIAGVAAVATALYL